MSLTTPVLVLNQNYQPLNVCYARRAIILIGLGKAELIENGRGNIRSISQVFPLPSVIRLIHMVKLPEVQRKLSRRAVFVRDDFMCQYCGTETRFLTLDHIMPRSRGGAHIWQNVVSACVLCNHRKAGATLKEANMRLLRRPSPPGPYQYSLFHHSTIMDEWRQFIPWIE